MKVYDRRSIIRIGLTGFIGFIRPARRWYLSINCMKSNGYANVKQRFVISRSPVRFRQVAYFSISYDDDKKASRIDLVFTQLHGDINIMILS